MKRDKTESMMSRRDCLKTCLAGSAGLAVAPSLFASPAKTDIWVIHGEDKLKLMEAAFRVIGENGGFGKNVSSLAVKINASWERRPEQGANTHPDLVEGFLTGYRNLGIQEVVLADFPCGGGPERTFTLSGIQDVANRRKATLIGLKPGSEDFTDVTLPGAVQLKKARAAKVFLQADAVLNMPVAKSHHSSTVTISCKNWMGAVENRMYFHATNLHQCIADSCTLFKPAWTLIDATRVMMTGGPQGPSENMKYPNMIILSKDQVAADFYTAELLVKDPLMVPHLKIAKAMGLGETDKARMNIIKKEA